MNNKIIAFTEVANNALSDIFKKYNLEENDNEIKEIMKSEKPFKINIIVKLIREFAKKERTQEDFINSLQKELKIDKETAKKIFDDISKNIIPFLIETSEEEIKKGKFKHTENKNINLSFLEQGEKVLPLPKDKMPISFTDVTEKTQTLEEKSTHDKIVSPVVPPKELKQKIKKSIISEITEEPTPKPKQAKGSKSSDKYREPVE